METDDPAKRAIEAVAARARRARAEATARWTALTSQIDQNTIEHWAPRFATAGRLTVNFHPDRIAAGGLTVAAGLRADGRYRSQWVTGLSSGSRSAVPGGERHRWEHELFDGAYTDPSPAPLEHPLYGAYDLMGDPHGGSPRFGSSFLVLRPQVLARATLCVGDSHAGPTEVGTIAEPWCLLAGLAEQAAAATLFDRGLGLVDLFTVLAGRKALDRPGRCLDGYMEAQIHGGVDLRTDVDAIVLDPSFRGTSVEEDLSSTASRCGFALRWHGGSELAATDVGPEFRGPTMPALARLVARPDGILDAAAIGRAAAALGFGPPGVAGDPPDSDLQQLKYLWHTLLAQGHDAA